MVPAQIVIDWLHLFTLAAAVGFLLHEVGLISLGHAGMVLVGAYAIGFLWLGDISWWMAVPLVVVFGASLSAAVLRVQSDTFAVVTLAFATIVNRVSVGATEWTGGSLGLGPIPRPNWVAGDLGAIALGSSVAIVAVVAYAAAGILPIGWKMGGIRDNELVARTQGIRTRPIMFTAVFGTGILAAGVGGIEALFFGLVTPRMGSTDVMLQALAAAMLARPAWRQGAPLGTLFGYAAAALMLVLVPPVLRQVLPETVTVDVLRQALFGATLYGLVHPAVQKRWSVGKP